jgi:transposase
MRNRQFVLSETEVNELQGAFHNCEHGQTKVRFQAVRLYGQGHRVQEIESICGCSRSSLMEWCHAYRQDGIAGLIDKRQGGNRAQLQPVQIEMICELLHSYRPEQLWSVDECIGDGQFWTVPDLARLVEARCGVVYKSDNSYRSLFRQCEFSLQRPGHFYKSRKEQAVVTFEEELEKN